MRVEAKKLIAAIVVALGSAWAVAQVDVPVAERSNTVESAPSQDAKAEENLKVESKKIPFPVRYELSRTVSPGRTKTHNEGKEGELRSFYRVTEENGKIKKELVKTERIEPVARVILMGSHSFMGSRGGSFVRGEAKVMHASAYDPSAGRGSRATFRTATGYRAQYGHVAVDPRVIPLGSLVYVEGYGIAIASDTGGAIKGNRIDLCMNSYAEAMRFGRKTVKVYVLRKA